MAIVGFLLGSVMGAVSGLLGWAAFNISLLAALSLYILTGLSVGMLIIALGYMRRIQCKRTDSRTHETTRT